MTDESPPCPISEPAVGYRLWLENRVSALESQVIELTNAKLGIEVQPEPVTPPTERPFIQADVTHLRHVLEDHARSLISRASERLPWRVNCASLFVDLSSRLRLSFFVSSPGGKEERHVIWSLGVSDITDLTKLKEFKTTRSINTLADLRTVALSGWHELLRDVEDHINAARALIEYTLDT